MQIKFILSILFCVLIIFSCKTIQNVDAVSSATKKYDPNKSIELPEKSDTYEVLGKLEGLKNFAVKYDGNFFRGGELYEPSGIETLKKLGVKTIVSITPSDTERELAKENNIKLVELVFDSQNGLSEEKIEAFLKVLNEVYYPVYAHCHSGSHRGGILGILYRIQKSGWNWDKAVDEFVKLGGDLEKDKIMLESIKF